MNRAMKEEFLTQFSNNVDNFLELDKRLAAAIPFAVKNNIPVSYVINKVLPKYKDNWHKDLCDRMESISETKFLNGSYYGRLAGFASKEIEGIFANYDEWDKASVYELRMNVRLYLSNLLKAMDVFTRIYLNYCTRQFVADIYKSCEVSAERDIQLKALLKSSELDHEVATFFHSPAIVEKMDARLLALENYVIKPDLLQDDIILRLQYSQKVCPEAIAILEPYSISLTRNIAYTLIEQPTPELQIAKAEEIEQDIGSADENISLVKDYEILYLEIAKNEEPAIRNLQISKLPSDIIEEVLIEGKVTERLREYAYPSVSIPDISTGEF